MQYPNSDELQYDLNHYTSWGCHRNLLKGMYELKQAPNSLKCHLIFAKKASKIPLTLLLSSLHPKIIWSRQFIHVYRVKTLV